MLVIYALRRLHCIKHEVDRARRNDIYGITFGVVNDCAVNVSECEQTKRLRKVRAYFRQQYLPQAV
jgi:hypothetical protein